MPTLTKHNLDTAEILNPKRRGDSGGRKKEKYSYYAGYSRSFTSRLFQTVGLHREDVILDPWNGAGTTTSVSSRLEYRSIGFDLNPVMVVVAKSNEVGIQNIQSITPLAKEILSTATNEPSEFEWIDPLEMWFETETSRFIRSLEKALQKVLLPNDYQILKNRQIEDVSSLSALFYVALFNMARSLVSSFRGSNPTWLKTARSSGERLQIPNELIAQKFLSHVQDLEAYLQEKSNLRPLKKEASSLIDIASSTSLPLKDSSVDFVLTSPPYCTRIDYAVKTRVELALLGYGDDESFRALRHSLLGTATVPKTKIDVDRGWGSECSEFLEKVYSHPSKASKTYYYSNHLQYFKGMSDSIKEIKRVTRDGGSCVFVVQTSYYKEIFNNLPKIITEMSENSGLNLRRREDFVVGQDMSRVHRGTRTYRSGKAPNYESVIVFENVSSRCM